MTIPYDKIENEAAWLAWQCVEQTSVNIFLTGNAGTGKTTFLKNLRQYSPKRMVVVAPTGVAAINANGVTIHSFFQLPFSPYIPGTKPKLELNVRREKINIMRTLDLLVIDEISMVRADMLDAIDAILRLYRHSEKPFGGVQLLMIGDLQQLSPVVVESERDIVSQYYATPYFFSSVALQKTVYTTIELKRIYRQNDRIFVELLNKIRNNQTDEATLKAINTRYIPNFNPDDSEKYIRLTTHNNSADSYNMQKLEEIKSKSYTYECKVEGKFPETSYPADKELVLKVGAQVMFIKNDKSTEKRFYNGKIGKVSSLSDDKVTVSCDEESDIEVSYDEWQNTRYEIDKTTNEISEVVDGTFSQIPLRLAWAITIHKSQGLTFEKAIIDAQMSFAHGQVYVALSRCRTIQGLVLSSPITSSSIINDGTVNGFIEQQADNAMTDSRMETSKSEYFVALISELFNFKKLSVPSYKLQRLLEEHCYNNYPKAIKEIGIIMEIVQTKILDISNKFVTLSNNMKMSTDLRNDTSFADRIRNGAKYFCEQISIFDNVLTTTNLAIDNKTVSKQLDELRDQLKSEYLIKKFELKSISNEGFSTLGYLQAKANAILSLEKNEEEPTQRKAKTTPSDIKHKGLYTKLVQWRHKMAHENNTDEYMIIGQKAIIDIANYLPTDLKKLILMKGIGKIKVNIYGNDILKMVNEYIDENNIDNSEIPDIENIITPKKKKKQKQQEEKISTHEQTLLLYRQYGSAEKVATERGLKLATIVGHLIDLVKEGIIDIEYAMGKERYNELCEMIKKNEKLSIGELCIKLQNNNYFYKEISYVALLLYPEKAQQ